MIAIAPLNARLKEQPAIRDLLATCVDSPACASVALVAARRRPSGMALSVAAAAPERGGWPLTRAARRAIRVALQSRRTLLHEGRASRHGSLHQPTAGAVAHTLVVAPVVAPSTHNTARAGAEEDACAWGALAARCHAGAVDGALIHHLEVLATRVARVLTDERDAPGARDPADADATSLGCGTPRDVLLHELRTPLSAAGIALDVLAGWHLPRFDDEARRLLRTAHLGVREAHSLLRWYSQLRGAEDYGAPRLETVALDEMIARAIALVPAAGARLHVSVPAEAPPVLADPLWLTQALANLLENATHYAPPGVPMWVNQVNPGGAARVPPGHAGVVVAHAGTPIPFDQRELIFHPYHRGVATDDLTSQGLGLSIARHFVRAMGGELRLETDAPESTAFIVLLPIAD